MGYLGLYSPVLFIFLTHPLIDLEKTAQLFVQVQLENLWRPNSPCVCFYFQKRSYRLSPSSSVLPKEGCNKSEVVRKHVGLPSLKQKEKLTNLPTFLTSLQYSP